MQIDGCLKNQYLELTALFQINMLLECSANCNTDSTQPTPFHAACKYLLQPEPRPDPGRREKQPNTFLHIIKVSYEYLAVEH